jgi:YbbR domain-containing protein
MRLPGFSGGSESGDGGAPRAGIRAFGTARTNMGVRLGGMVSPESLVRLVLAFVLSTALWLFVTNQQAQGSFPYPHALGISSAEIGPGLDVANQLGNAHISVASTGDLFGVYEAQVNLTGKGPGHYRLPVKIVPQGSTTSWTPRQVTVDIERAITRVVSVRVVVAGPPPFGFSVRPGSIRSYPRTVTVSGPQSLVAPVSSAAVSLSLSQATSSVDTDVAPTLVDEVGRRLSSRLIVNPGLVRVHAGIIQLLSYKTLPVIATIRGTPATGTTVTRIRVSPAFLTSYGPHSALRQLVVLRTKPISVAGLSAGSHRMTVSLHRIAGAGVDSGHVRVTITVSPIQVASTTRVGVTIGGVSSGLTASLSVPTVRITFMAPENKILAVSPHLKATVRADGLSAGIHAVSIHVQAPAGVRIETVYPPSASLTLSRG